MTAPSIAGETVGMVSSADSAPQMPPPDRYPSMSFARALCIGATVGVLVFASLLLVQLIKVGKTGYAVPNMRTMPDGRRVPAFTWDLRLLNLPATLLRRHTALRWTRPQVVEYPHKPRPTRPGWSFAGWVAIGGGGYAMSFAAVGAITSIALRRRRRAGRVE